MDSRLISKLEKARRYADEPERVEIQEYTLHFKGEHSTHTIRFQDGEARCSCSEYIRAGDCPHTLAIKYMLQRAFDRENIDHTAHLLSSV